MYFSGKEKRDSGNWWKTCGMRDSREKGAGMRGQDPPLPDPHIIFLLNKYPRGYSNRGHRLLLGQNDLGARWPVTLLWDVAPPSLLQNVATGLALGNSGNSRLQSSSCAATARIPLACVAGVRKGSWKGSARDHARGRREIPLPLLTPATLARKPSGMTEVGMLAFRPCSFPHNSQQQLQPFSTSKKYSPDPRFFIFLFSCHWLVAFATMLFSRKKSFVHGTLFHKKTAWKPVFTAILQYFTYLCVTTVFKFFFGITFVL